MKGDSVNKDIHSITSTRRAFTLVEVMIAAVISAFVLGGITMTISQLARAKDTSKTRLDAHLRADAALNAIRMDVASVIRHDNLFWTRLLIRPDVIRAPIGDVYRDEILVFNNRLRPIHDIDFNGEGMQYETQYRLESDDYGSFLWQRRDPVPDEYPLAGGIATPVAEGIVALKIEAYDGLEWHREWDSDDRGLPEAVRVTLIASGHRNGDDLWTAPMAHLRTVIAIDRVLPPSDLFRLSEEELAQEQEEQEDVSDAPTASPSPAADEGRGAGGPDGRRPGAQPGQPGARPDSPRGNPGTRPAQPGRGGQTPQRGPSVAPR